MQRPLVANYSNLDWSKMFSMQKCWLNGFRVHGLQTNMSTNHFHFYLIDKNIDKNVFIEAGVLL